MDTSRYSLWGGSAGARMAAWLGTYGPAAFSGDDLPPARRRHHAVHRPERVQPR